MIVRQTIRMTNKVSHASGIDASSTTINEDRGIHVFEIHWPTSAWHLGLFAIIVFALYCLRRWYRKKKKRNAEKMARAWRLRHRALEYHPSKSQRRLEEGDDGDE